MSSILSPREPALMNVAIRADAGPAIGTGHVMRMMALAHACGQLGAQVTMLCGDLPQGIVQRLIRHGIHVQQLNSSRCDEADAAETLAVVNDLDADWIVLDGYGFDQSYQRTVAESDALLMMMDDAEVADRSIVDVILNQNVYASDDIQSDRFLGGCRFTLLRSEFLSAATNSDPRPTRKFAKRLLVTLGGCDDADWTKRVLSSLASPSMQKLVVDVVVGAGYRHLESLRELKRNLPFSLRIHQNVDRMVDLMQQVDMAISAGGSTCYELARCGVPAIGIPVAPNQEPIVAALDQRGSLRAFEPLADIAECNQQLKSSIKSLIHDSDARASMSRVGRELVDGKGALRIARFMANRGITFREADLHDSPQLLMWRNDPEVRSVSLTPHIAAEDTFQKVLQEQLQSPDHHLWIVESRRGEPIGTVRVDMQQPQQAFIELTLDHVRRGKGLGRSVIQKACELTFAENPLVGKVMAQICPGNVASERAFRSVGFVKTQPAMVDKKLVFQFVLFREKRDSAKRAA